MRISELKNEEALDFLADIIEPASEIMSDDAIKNLVTNKINNKGAVVKTLLKNHKKSIIEILARLDGVPVDEYEVNVFTLPIKILELLNDKELADFFTSQVAMAVPTSSIEPMENTKGKEK